MQAFVQALGLAVVSALRAAFKLALIESAPSTAF